MKKKWFEPRMWRLAHGRSLTLGEKAHIMGILNVTPDSFSDGGLYEDVDKAVEQAELMCKQGATIIDVGGESTRPNAEPVDIATEQKRVLPVIKALSEKEMIISIDTYNGETALAAIEAGAHIVNDIWGCRKSETMAQIVEQTQCGLVVMHNNRALDGDAPEAKGKEMNVVEDQIKIFNESLSILEKYNIDSDQYVLDVGFGFGKDSDYNMELLSVLDQLHGIGGCGMMIGTSRKRFLRALTKEESEYTTAATSIYARLKGVDIMRVHDCLANHDALCVAEELINKELK